MNSRILRISCTPHLCRQKTSDNMNEYLQDIVRGQVSKVPVWLSEKFMSRYWAGQDKLT